MFLRSYLVFLAAMTIISKPQSFSQEGIKFENWVYSKDIKSVQTIVNGIIASIPVMRLGSADIMTIQFDDIAEEEDNEFYYKIIHCDRNWNKTEIDEIQFIDGFSDERIRDWQLSIGTKQKFTHYWLTVPNRDMRLIISGNYLLYIYNKFEDEEPLITRRFIVSENIVNGDAKWVRPTDTEFIRFKQQLNLSLAIRNLRLQNPMRDVSLTIVQNGDWKNALEQINARNIKDGLFTFDNFGQLSFWGNNEFRTFDTRSLNSRGFGIKSIEYFIDGIDVNLHPLRRHDRKVYSYNFDFNGNYFIDNTDLFRRIIFDASLADKNKLQSFRQSFGYFDALENGWQIKEKEVRSDYARINFTLESEKLFNDVYVYGAFSDFQLKDEFKMKYDDRKGVYFGEALLKQGYYDYAFAEKGEDGLPVFNNTEGSWQDSENEYKIIIYLQEFGSRYDRVLGVVTRNSIDFTY